MRERAEEEKIQGKCAASSASDTRIRAGIVKDHETILLLSVFSLITGQHRHRKLWSCHFLVFCWQWSLLNRNTKTLCLAICRFVILDYPWRRGSGGQWGEIPDINELVPDPVSTLSSQTYWPFMLTDDFITEVMRSLTAGKCGETQQPNPVSKLGK